MNYVVYSHTDYLDILKVHSEYLPFENTTLIINSNEFDINDLYSKYKNIIFYDDSLPYAGRVLTSIKQIEESHFLFIHDMDIPVIVDKEMVSNYYELAVRQNLHRIDLQQDARMASNEMYEYRYYYVIKDSDTHMVKSDSLAVGIYNVNPSIWNKEVFIEILEKYSDRSYRTIEGPDVQQYCTKFEFWKLNSQNWINAGYYRVTPMFQFLHLSHGGKLLPVEGNNCDEHINEEYKKIRNNFNLEKEIRNNMF